MVSLKRLAVITASLAALLLIACGGDDATATATPSSIFPTAAPPTATVVPTATTAPTATKPPKAPGPQFRVNLGGEPNTLDPQLASSLLEFSVLRQLSEGLVGFDKEAPLVLVDSGLDDNDARNLGLEEVAHPASPLASWSRYAP